MTERPPRLLFVVRSFPPIASTAATRSRNLTTALLDLGWDITVLTLDPAMMDPTVVDEGIAIRHERLHVRYTGHRRRFLLPGYFRESPYPVIRKGLRLVQRVYGRLHLNRDAGWIAPLASALRKLDGEDFDAVVVTGPPFVAFPIVADYARRNGRRLFLDYRDPWTINAHGEGAVSPTLLARERAILEGAEKAVFVSEPWAKAVQEVHGFAFPYAVISNGYDPARFVGVEAEVPARPTFVYAGVLYPPKRVLDPVIEAMKILNVELGCDAALHVYGPGKDEITAAIHQRNAGAVVEYKGFRPQGEIFRAIKGAAGSVVITSVFRDGDQLDRGIVTGKIFESMGLRSPILLIAPEGSEARKVVESSQCGFSTTGEDPRHIASLLAKMVENPNQFSFAGSEQYSWKALIGRYHRILRPDGTPDDDCGKGK